MRRRDCAGLLMMRMRKMKQPLRGRPLRFQEM